MTTNNRNYYAISWTHGRIWTDAGHRIGEYRRFANRADRDAWVEDGASLTTDRDHREAIPASDAEIRRIRREQA